MSAPASDSTPTSGKSRSRPRAGSINHRTVGAGSIPQALLEQLKAPPAPPEDEEQGERATTTAGPATTAQRKLIKLKTRGRRSDVDEKSAQSQSLLAVADGPLTPASVKKSPRRLAQSAASATNVMSTASAATVANTASAEGNNNNSVQFDNVETIGEEEKKSSSRRRGSKTSVGAVKKKGRVKKSSSSRVGLKQELAGWKSMLSDAKNEELVAKIEELVDTLSSREPSLFKSGSKQQAAEGVQQSRVAALQRLCRRWLQRREALRQPEARAVRDRLRVWDAFIASEKKYFLTLLTIVQKCMRPMMTAAPQHVTEETLVEVFGSLPEIKDQSKALLSKLRAGTNGAQWISSTGLGALFLNEVMPVMKSYVLYVVEYPKRMQTLARLLRKVPELRSVVDKAFASDGGATGQSLAEMLLAPMHRMLAYEWTLQELLRMTPDDHCCREDLQKAVMGCAQLNLMLVMQKKQAARAQMLSDAGDIHPAALGAGGGSGGGGGGGGGGAGAGGGGVMPDSGAAFGGSEGRQFVRDGPVYVMGLAGEAEKRHLYLFSDVLAVGTLRPSGIVFDEALLLRSCELTDSDEAVMAKFVFEISGTGEGVLSSTLAKKTLVVSCNTLEEKKSWMNDVNMAINSLVSDKQLAIATDNKALTALDMDKVAANMRHPASGVPVKTRKRRLQVFANAFVGSDAVDWLARNYSLPRRAAVELGQTLMCAHYFHHVSYGHSFDDKKELFEFQELGEGAPKLPAELNHAELVKKMFHPQQGVALQQRKGRFGMAKKKSVFAGADAVDWLSKNLKVQRHVAISIGEQLLSQNAYFSGLNGVEVFADDKSFTYGLKSGTMEDLSFPTERVLKALRELKGSPLYKGSGEDLDYVIKMLTSGGNLYTSNLMAILDQDVDLDQDTKKFVLSYAGDQATSLKKKMQEKALTSITSSLVISEGGAASKDASQRSPLINSLVAKVGDWDFPVFRLDEESNHTGLYAMGYALFVAHDLINKFNIDEKKLSKFLLAMNDGYKKTMYHNSVHASDVVQTVNFFLKTGPAAHLSDTETFGIILAAIIHDFDHPGLNNAFMINSRSEIAIRYNDVSVLENYHIASAYQILLKEEYNIFSNCSEDVYKEVRSTVISSVLATDFGKHFDILGQFKSKVASGGLDYDKAEDRRLVLQLALKCADISHTTKSLETHRKWTEAITEEFYSQGDKEREKSLPLSPYMDRASGNLPKSQLGFIGFLAQPLYEAWCGTFEGSSAALEGVVRNLAYWKDLSEKDAATAAPAAAAAANTAK